jgi:hypothetical protein
LSLPGTVFASARVTIRALGLEDAGPLRAMHADRRATALLVDDDFEVTSAAPPLTKPQLRQRNHNFAAPYMAIASNP